MALGRSAWCGAAPKIAERYGLIEKKQIDPERVKHLPPEDQEKYRREMAILDVKLRGLMFSAPGFILIMIVFN